MQCSLGRYYVPGFGGVADVAVARLATSFRKAGISGYPTFWAILWSWTTQIPVKQAQALNTDGALIYKTIDQWWPVKHTRDIHKKFEFAHTSEIEGAFGNLRTFIRRMYHHVTPEKLPDYVREFCARFSLPELFKNPNIYLKKTLSLVPID